MSAGIDAFAAESRRFILWASGNSREAMDAATALRRVVALYFAALELPSPFRDSTTSVDAERVGDSEWRSVYERTKALPLQYYGEVYDPLPVPPDAPVVGDLADDIADIYRDVAAGLRHFDAGEHGEALWEWGFGFRSHWGEHATSAIRALHGYLSEVEPECLSAGG